MESLQHVQLPHDMTKNKKLTPNDLWVYICVRSFMNGKTKECFPSLQTISNRSGFSITTVRNSIDILHKEGWMSVVKVGRAQNYLFKHSDRFEVFSYNFIMKKDIIPKEKSYLVAMQQYMYKDTPGLGKSSYKSSEISKIINLSETRVNKYEQSLVDKGYLSIVDSGKKDLESGIFIKNKFFKLDELGQGVVFALQDHHKKLEEHDGEISHLADKLVEAEKNNEKHIRNLMKMQKELDMLKARLKEEKSDKFTF